MCLVPKLTGRPLYNLQLNEEEIEERYGPDSLEPEMTDEMYKLVCDCSSYLRTYLDFLHCCFQDIRHDTIDITLTLRMWYAMLNRYSNVSST